MNANYYQIPFDLDLDIQMPMPCDLRQHVIEKGNTGCNLVIAFAIEVQADADIRFIRLPRLRRYSGIHYFFSKTRSSAARNRSFSSGVPIDTRSQRSTGGSARTSRTSTP